MKEEDLFDIGEREKVEEKSVTQLMNGYGELYSRIGGTVNTKMRKAILGKMEELYLEVHRRILQELRRSGGEEKGKGFGNG